MAEPWQEDWNAFVDLVAKRLAIDESSDALTPVCGEKNVVWRGKLKEKSIDELAPTVEVSPPERTIVLKRKRSVQLSVVCVPVARDAVAAWKKLKIGATVTFSATLGGGGPFPAPVELMILNSGRPLIMLRMKDGAPIS